jgi:phage terminase large subunit-like protein
MAQKQPAFLKKFGVEVHANKLERTSDGSRFEPIIGDPGDGSSPSLYIGDEYHEHDSDNQRDTMVTGMGAREQGLELLITTAGTNSAGPCALHQKDVEKVLGGVVSDGSLFGVIYTIDKDDDWKSEQALIKANPNYGVSVSTSFLKDEQSKAIQSARKQNKFKTKHLDVWCGAKEAWLNSEDWVSAGNKDLSLDDFKGMVCGNGLDLSKTDDLTSRVKCFAKDIDGVEHYYFFGNHYVTKVKAEDNQLYQGWINDGWLTECDANEGKMIDYQLVRDDFDEDLFHFEIEDIYHDPAGANVLAQQIDTSTNVEAVEIPQTFRVFSPYMRDFEVLLSAGRIHHNGDPVLAWCFSNVVAKETQDGKYIRPVKEDRDNKIDAAVAALMAFIKVYEPKDEYDDQQAMEEYLDGLGA